MNREIREIRLADTAAAEELWAVQHAAYREEARRIGVPDLPPLRDTVRSLQACGETFYGCYSEDGELAGAVSIEKETDDAWVICRMLVHPDFFRRGIATRLLNHVMALAPSGGVLTVTAEIRNEPAIRLYESGGFVREGTIQPAPGITMIRFRRRISET